MLETFVFIQILWIFRINRKKKNWTFRKSTTTTQEISWLILLTFAYCLKWYTILFSFFKNASKLKIFKIENEIDVFVLKICFYWEFSCGSAGYQDEPGQCLLRLCKVLPDIYHSNSPILRFLQDYFGVFQDKIVEIVK